MPNEVYLRTRDGLARLLSPRAAARVLDDALRSCGVRPEALRDEQVRDLLMGPVRHELEGILPRAGLRRTLRRLARSLRDEARRQGRPMTTSHDGRASDGGEVGALHPVTASSVYLPGVALPDEPDTIAAGTPLERRADPRPASSEAPGARADGGAVGVLAAPDGSPRRPAAPAATVVPPARSAAEVERLVRTFAHLDGVLQVVAVGERGEVVLERGSGLDAAGAAPLVRTATHLLGRHGRLRSMVLEHAGGLLFVFPMGRETAVVRTRAPINLGAVLAARSALEEGL